MFYHTNLIKLSALGILRKSTKVGATKYNNRNFARGSPTELFLISNQFRQLKQTTKILQGVHPHSFFSLPGQLQNQGQILIVLKKIKALPEGGQQLNYNNNKDQDRVLIRRQTGYRTRYKSETS